MTITPAQQLIIESIKSFQARLENGIKEIAKPFWLAKVKIDEKAEGYVREDIGKT